MTKLLTNYTPYLKSIILLMMAFVFCAFNLVQAEASVMDDIKADMTKNEAYLFGAPTTTLWSKESIMTMSTAPRGDNTPYYWNPDNLDYKSSKYWTTIAPWFVIAPGVLNATTTNTRIKISDIKLYIFDKSTSKWNTISESVKPTWASDWGSMITLGTLKGVSPARIEPDGKFSYKISDNSYFVHGGSGKFDFTTLGIKPENIGAVFAYLTSELIIDDPKGVDDRDKAQFLVSVGVDYYPTITTTVKDFYPVGYVPNSVGSRYGLVKNTPRIHYAATIDPPGQKNLSPYIINGGKSTMPIDQFIASMPPIPASKEIVVATTSVGTGNSSVSTTTNTSTNNSSETTKDTQSPTISIVSPTEGKILSGTRTFKANAQDNVGIKSVELFIDNVSKGVSGSSKFSKSINTIKLNNGAHFVFAKAIDTSNNVSVSSVVNFNVQNNTDDKKTVLKTTNDSNLAKTTKTSLGTSTEIVATSTKTQINNSVCVGAITTTLVYGMENTQISTLQCKLTNLGLLAPGNIVGYFGPKTLAAVRKLQCDNNLVCSGDQNTTGYGLVGPKTRLILGY